MGGHDPANIGSQRVLVTTASGTTLRGALQPARKPPKIDEFFVDLGMGADEVKEAVRVGDYVR